MDLGVLQVTQLVCGRVGLGAASYCGLEVPLVPVYLLDDRIAFPDPREAEPEGWPVRIPPSENAIPEVRDSGNPVPSCPLLVGVGFSGSG